MTNYEENEYVLKKEAILLLPEYDEFGNLTTKLFGVDKVRHIRTSPTELIDYNLRYHGYSLRGASAGAQLVLGVVRMAPVVLSEQMDMYWFPALSPVHEGCVWFALHHIKDYECMGKKRTRVFFNDNSKIELDISKYSFEKKVLRASFLKYKMESRLNQGWMLAKENQTPYRIRKQPNGQNYDLESFD